MVKRHFGHPVYMRERGKRKDHTYLVLIGIECAQVPPPHTDTPTPTPPYTHTHNQQKHCVCGMRKQGRGTQIIFILCKTVFPVQKNTPFTNIASLEDTDRGLECNLSFYLSFFFSNFLLYTFPR